MDCSAVVLIAFVTPSCIAVQNVLFVLKEHGECNPSIALQPPVCRAIRDIAQLLVQQAAAVSMQQQAT
jgi:hypothetical protein